MLRLMGLLVLLSALPLRAADEPVLPELKDFHLTTTLVADGQPDAMIVSAQGDGYDVLAEVICGSRFAMTIVPVELVDAPSASVTVRVPV